MPCHHQICVECFRTLTGGNPKQQGTPHILTKEEEEEAGTECEEKIHGSENEEERDSEEEVEECTNIDNFQNRCPICRSRIRFRWLKN